jgi:hypothetical protein
VATQLLDVLPVVDTYAGSADWQNYRLTELDRVTDSRRDTGTLRQRRRSVKPTLQFWVQHHQTAWLEDTCSHNTDAV